METEAAAEIPPIIRNVGRWSQEPQEPTSCANEPTVPPHFRHATLCVVGVLFIVRLSVNDGIIFFFVVRRIFLLF